MTERSRLAADLEADVTERECFRGGEIQAAAFRGLESIAFDCDRVFRGSKADESEAAVFRRGHLPFESCGRLSESDFGTGDGEPRRVRDGADDRTSDGLSGQYGREDTTQDDNRNINGSPSGAGGVEEYHQTPASNEGWPVM